MRQDNLLLNNSTINSEFNFIPSNLYNPNTNKLNYINIDSKYNNINTSPVTLINNVLYLYLKIIFQIYLLNLII